MSKICANCGADCACLGFRLPGGFSRLDSKYQKYVWACTAAACVSAIEARRDALMLKIGLVSAERPRVAAGKPADRGQGVLL